MWQADGSAARVVAGRGEVSGVSDFVVTKYVSPDSAGWVRVPDCPRTWEKPNGELFTFPPHASEVLVVPAEGLLTRMRREATTRGLLAEFEKFIWGEDRK
jgi:hypothetical protein